MAEQGRDLDRAAAAVEARPETAEDAAREGAESAASESAPAPVQPEALAQEAAPDTEALRLAVAARIRDIVEDVDRLVLPVEDRPLDGEEDSEEDEDESEDEEDADSSEDEEGDEDESEDEEDADSADEEEDEAESEDEEDADSAEEGGDEDEEDVDSAEDEDGARAAAEEGADDDEDDSENESEEEPGGEDSDEAGDRAAHDDGEALSARAGHRGDAAPARSGGEQPRAPRSGARAENTIIVPAKPGLSLRVKLDEREPVLVSRERFIIGRGPNCDLVVRSARVSREHVAVVREGAEYFIEDLKSSNGTWFQEARITRRHVSDGDEYLLGGIRVTFTLS
ncbi:FHA domain-containing protein [Myxococcus sp. RHST-1-4]|nr:FHA domain-containing protein [Myxococcus sp. RHSTA-1-4]